MRIIGITSPDDEDQFNFFIYKTCVVISLNCERFLWNRWVRIVNICMWPTALAILAYETPQLDYGINSSQDFHFFVLDNIVNSWLLVKGTVRLCGLFMRIKIEKAYQREVTVIDAILGSGVLQLLATCACFGFGFTDVGLWIRLVRLALTTSTVLEVFPHINILMSGVTHGLRSISYTVLVLFLLILCYASLGHYLFAVNDPFHFGTYAQAALTFFQLSTFENWSTVYYINYYGCDSFPSEYSNNVGPIDQAVTVRTDYGDFLLPLCFDAQAQPVAASLVFVSFSIMGGYVVISMCLATVAIGINERLQALRRLAVYGGDMAHTQQTDAAHDGRSGNNHKAPGGGGAKASKLIGSIKEKALMKALLFKTWDTDGSSGSSLGGPKTSTFKGSKSSKPSLVGDDKDQLQNALFVHTLLNSQLHDGVISCLIAADAALQIYNEGYAYSLATFGLHSVINILLCVDILLRLYAVDPDERLRFMVHFWNVFDTVIIAILFASLGLENQPEYDWLRAVRFVRLGRILKLYSGVFGDLMVILSSLSNSFICVLYVLALVLVFFLLFAVGGVLLFKQADPYYFGDLGSSLKTLLQVMTQDNWSNVMRTCMIGCRHYGYDTGTPALDDLCDGANGGNGVGWWSAAYFVTFMIMSSMVLANLMVGVIISSMELLREGFKEETTVWENVRRIQTAYDIKAENIHRMLDLWEMLDKGSNGFLTFEETQPVMDLVNLKTVKQFELYMKSDMNKNGQINFHEFCELVHDLDRKRKDPTNCEDHATIAAAAAEQRNKIKQGGLVAMITRASSGAILKTSIHRARTGSRMLAVYDDANEEKNDAPVQPSPGASPVVGDHASTGTGDNKRKGGLVRKGSILLSARVMIENVRKSSVLAVGGRTGSGKMSLIAEAAVQGVTEADEGCPAESSPEAVHVPVDGQDDIILSAYGGVGAGDEGAGVGGSSARSARSNSAWDKGLSCTGSESMSDRHHDTGIDLVTEFRVDTL